MHKKGIYERFFKRPFDLFVSLIALIVLSPLMIILAILVRIKLGHPVIFKQKRPGLNEKIFTLYKFRTMTDKKDDNGELLPDSERLTKFGKFLRSTSMDELPGLINIIKGDMSIVGPRPLLVEYLGLYTVEQRKRHEVKPGLTGLAQINGRNNQTWELRFRYDKDYLDNISFFLDLKIIFSTFGRVVNRVDINEEGVATKNKLGKGDDR